MSKLDAFEFYRNFLGHTLNDLQLLYSHLQKTTEQRIFLVGDSSLDNKHWLFENQKLQNAALVDPTFTAPACWQYEDVLTPARCVKDIAYWINALSSGETAAINCAVEMSTLERRKDRLLKQDEFVRDNIDTSDVLVVSVGGNDIALRPSNMTRFCMALLILTPTWLIRLGITPGLGHFVSLFKDATENYINRLTVKKRPQKVVVCMLYYPDKSNAAESWANRVLSLMGYDRNPSKLQAIIRRVFARATSKIEISNSKVIPLPLFTVLDGSDPNDYRERVEPSVQGGRKIASAILNSIYEAKIQ